jgi:hypothetical protein
LGFRPLQFDLHHHEKSDSPEQNPEEASSIPPPFPPLPPLHLCQLQIRFIGSIPQPCFLLRS